MKDVERIVDAILVEGGGCARALGRYWTILVASGSLILESLVREPGAYPFGRSIRVTMVVVSLRRSLPGGLYFARRPRPQPKTPGGPFKP